MRDSLNQSNFFCGGLPVVRKMDIKIEIKQQPTVIVPPSYCVGCINAGLKVLSHECKLTWSRKKFTILNSIEAQISNFVPSINSYRVLMECLQWFLYRLRFVHACKRIMWHSPYLPFPLVMGDHSQAWFAKNIQLTMKNMSAPTVICLLVTNGCHRRLRQTIQSLV